MCFPDFSLLKPGKSLQSHALMRGLGDLIRPAWIRMFSPDELQMLVSGSTQPVDLQDLRSNSVYGGKSSRGGAGAAASSICH